MHRIIHLGLVAAALVTVSCSGGNALPAATTTTQPAATVPAGPSLEDFVAAGNEICTDIAADLGPVAGVPETEDGLVGPEYRVDDWYAFLSGQIAVSRMEADRFAALEAPADLTVALSDLVEAATGIADLYSELLSVIDEQFPGADLVDADLMNERIGYSFDPYRDLNAARKAAVATLGFDACVG